jgi:hypothetical protein
MHSAAFRLLSWAVLLVLLGVHGHVGAPPASARTAGNMAVSLRSDLWRQGTGLIETPVGGVTVTLLASHPFDDPGWIYQKIFFDRVPLLPGASMVETLTLSGDTGQMAPSPGPFEGPQLFYVEQGAVALTSDDGETTYSQGEQFVMAAGAEYDIMTVTGRCVSLLRLVVPLTRMPATGGGFDTNIDEPQLITPDCGTPRHFFEWEVSGRADPPARMVIAEVVWNPAEYDGPGQPGGLTPHTHPGPVGLVVESGYLLMTFPGSSILNYLLPGALSLIPEGEIHDELYPGSAGGEPAVALLAGVVEGEHLVVMNH